MSSPRRKMSFRRSANVTRSNSMISNLSSGDYKRDLSPKHCKSEANTKVEYDGAGNLLSFDEEVEEIGGEECTPNKKSVDFEDELNDSDLDTVIYCPKSVRDEKIFEMNEEAFESEDTEEEMFCVSEEDST